MGTQQEYLPILMMLGAAVLIAALLLVLNSFVGRKVRTRRKLMPYESGMPLLDESRKRISIKFFIVAMIFILFDVDTAFFYPWAVILREGGATAFWGMMPFLVLLVLGDIYLWKKGAFDW
ncbi:MAG TPA: NADH-quinone oxidoreductase subunit A [Thermoanaerobaculia bacterium]|nr:NADH-quinone oxidoreductase subunit A [Thermoanaerobaculia bacterium]